MHIVTCQIAKRLLRLNIYIGLDRILLVVFPPLCESCQVQCFELLSSENLKTLRSLLQIYVDEVPLPFPGHTLIAVAAAVLLGGLIFIAFMFQIRNIHPWDMFKKLIRRNNVNPTNITAN